MHIYQKAPMETVMLISLSNFKILMAVFSYAKMRMDKVHEQNEYQTTLEVAK